MTIQRRSDYPMAIPESQRVDKLVMCLHEAAHVVAARYFGFQVAWVSCDQEFLSNDPLAKANRLPGTISEATTMVIISHKISPIITRGFTVSSEEQAIIQGFCVEALAGPMAELLWNKSYDKMGCAADLAQVHGVLGRVEKNTVRRKMKRDRYKNEAREFVSVNADTIMRFACDLWNRGTILEADIDGLIAAANSATNRPPGHNGQPICHFSS